MSDGSLIFTSPKYATNHSMQGRQANLQETYSKLRDFTVQRSITRSQTQAHNILVSETAVMGDISKLEQQWRHS